MASKYQKIYNLSNDTKRSIIQSGEKWMDFLDTAYKMYMYPFHDLVLIHAQRPDATVCASYDTWNKKVNRWIKRGAKGIALFDTLSKYPSLRYVFDIADTRVMPDSKTPYLWEITPDNENVVLEHLQDRYMNIESDNLTDALREVAAEMVADNVDERMEQIASVVEGSFLEDTDEESLYHKLSDTMQDSLYYMLLKRCGLDARGYFGEDGFAYIREFNNPEVLSCMGDGVSYTANAVLSDIGQRIRVHEYQMHQNNLVEVD